MLPLELLFRSLLQLLVVSHESRSRKLVTIRDNGRRLGLLEDVQTHLLQGTTRASLVDQLQDVMS
jgi:hypothetical protein